MSLAVNNASDEKEFTRRYTGLLDYYGLEMEKIQPEAPNENGDVEQSHGGSRKRWSKPCCCVAAGTSRAVKPMDDSCKSWWPLAMRAAASVWTRSCLGCGVCPSGDGRAINDFRCQWTGEA